MYTYMHVLLELSFVYSMQPYDEIMRSKNGYKSTMHGSKMGKKFEKSEMGIKKKQIWSSLYAVQFVEGKGSKINTTVDHVETDIQIC